MPQSPTLEETSDLDVQDSAESDAGVKSKSASSVKKENKGFAGWYVLLILAFVGLLVVLMRRKRRKE